MRCSVTAFLPSPYAVCLRYIHAAAASGTPIINPATQTPVRMAGQSQPCKASTNKLSPVGVYVAMAA